jgi:hypothetical protein
MSEAKKFKTVKKPTTRLGGFYYSFRDEINF